MRELRSAIGLYTNKFRFGLPQLAFRGPDVLDSQNTFIRMRGFLNH